MMMSAYKSSWVSTGVSKKAAYLNMRTRPFHPNL